MKTFVALVAVLFSTWTCSGQSVGGYTPVDPKTIPNVLQAGQHAVLSSQTGVSMEFGRVISAKQQIVAGINYDLVIEFNVFATSASGVKTLDHVEQYEIFLFKNLQQQISVTKVQKLATAVQPSTNNCIPGGPCEHVIDAKTIKIAKFAVSAINKQNGTSLSLVRIISVYTQIVSGVNYYFKMDLTDGTSTAMFSAQVYEKLDLTLSLTSFSQENMGSGSSSGPIYTGPGPVMGGTGLGGFGQQQQAVGAWHPADMTDMTNVKIVMQASHFSFNQINNDLGNTLRYGTFQHVQSQVVAGMKFRFDLYTRTSSGHTQVYDVIVFLPPGQNPNSVATMKFDLLSYKQRVQGGNY